MICEGCKIIIKAEFTYAIKNNQCPACGKSIMQQEKLSSYLSLRALLGGCCNDKEVDKITSLITSNFELKQIFKEELQIKYKEDIIEPTEDKSSLNEEESVVITKKEKSKMILQKMRDDALAVALDGQEIELSEGEILTQDSVLGGNFRRSE